MASVEIQTDPDNSAYAAVVELDGLEYVFDFFYYERPDAWYFDMTTPEGERIISGRKVVLNYPLYRPQEDERVPQGLLMALAADGSTRRPTLGELGTRVYLAWIDPDDVPITEDEDAFLADIVLT